MNYTQRALVAAAALSVLGVAGCHGDFLTGGELSTDPNRPTVATSDQLFVSTEEELWTYWGGDPARITGMYAQQFRGLANQYGALAATYDESPGTTNGTHASLYTAGGLVDIVKLENDTRAAGDSVYLGVARVMEGALMGTGADLFGDLVYSQALSNTANPVLDNQMAVYDSVQKVLSAAIVDLGTQVSTNVGPGGADFAYDGDPAKWTALAHTLKARFYMHTAEKDPTAYAKALAEAQQGITSDAGNYVAVYASPSGEQNLYYQFRLQRGGDIAGGTFLDSLLKARNDPRDADYFHHTSSGDPDWISTARNQPDYPQPFVTYDENTLIWAEAAYRTGDMTTALDKLNEERANHGLPAESVSGQQLLDEILTEKYIADFQLGDEAWMDYKRTCTPNLVPPAPGLVMPGRWYYDTSEQSTDTNIPAPGSGVNNLRPANDPVNAVSDGTGQPCLAGA